jgi:hypothetical protein
MPPRLELRRVPRVAADAGSTLQQSRPERPDFRFGVSRGSRPRSDGAWGLTSNAGIKAEWAACRTTGPKVTFSKQRGRQLRRPLVNIKVASTLLLCWRGRRCRRSWRCRRCCRSESAVHIHEHDSENNHHDSDHYISIERRHDIAPPLSLSHRSEVKGTPFRQSSKLGHPQFQTRPLTSETGHYPRASRRRRTCPNCN